MSLRKDITDYVRTYDCQSVPLSYVLREFTTMTNGLPNLPEVSAALMELLKEGVLVLTPARYLNYRSPKYRQPLVLT